MLVLMPHDQSANPPTPRPAHASTTPATEPVDGVLRMATLSHELSNLLDGSLRCLTLAQTDLRGAFAEADTLDRATRRLDTVWQALERMASLVDGAMRDASRAIGRPGGPVGAIPIVESIHHAVDVLTPLASAALTRIETSFDGATASVPTGPLYTPILNAMQNAIQAIDRTGRPGRVRVEMSVEPRGESVLVVRVLDTGPGIPKGLNPFSGLATPGGHGIGLTLSAAIVHALGGEVSLESGADGRGACFTITCPVRTLGAGADGQAPWNVAGNGIGGAA